MRKIFRILGLIQSHFFTKHHLERYKCMPLCEQLAYVDKHNEPRDGIEAMALKNKDQFYRAYFTKLTLNFFSLFALPLVYLVVVFKTNKIIQKKSNKQIIYYGCINIDEACPQALIDRYKDAEYITNCESLILRKEDIRYLMKNLLKYKLSPYLFLRYTVKLSNYRYIIDSFSPEVIAITNELSPTSAAMTSYCNMHNISHVNFMHGEKLYSMAESFIHFDECFVYEEYYKTLFQRLRSSVSTKFTIFTPPKLLHDKYYKSSCKTTDFGFYLQTIDRKKIKILVNIIQNLTDKGYTVKVRNHPRFGNDKLLKKNIHSSYIEKTDEVNISDSIYSKKYIVSLHSAVLYQSIKLGLNVVVDDISDKYMYESLKDKKYIVLEHEHKLLSDIINSDINIT